MAKLVVSWVDGKASIAEIGEMCGMGEEMACRLVGDLARRGVLEVPGFEVGAAPAQTSTKSSRPIQRRCVASAQNGHNLFRLN